MQLVNVEVWKNVLVGETLLFGLLGKALYAELDKDWLESLIAEDIFAEAPFGEEQIEIQTGLKCLQSWTAENRAGISDEHFKALKCDNLNLFIGTDKILAPVWELVYFSQQRLVFQEQTLQVREWFSRFGLQLEHFNREPDDHIGLELSFLAHLASLALQALDQNDNQKFEAVLQAQREFLCEHLLCWGPVWARLVNEHAETDFYRGLAHLTHGALLAMAEHLQIGLPKEGIVLSLFETAERLAAIDRSQIVLDSKQCLHTQDQHSSCAACFEICPVHAITPGKPPVLESGICQNCLACLPVCPVGAFHADDDVAPLLNCVTHLEGKSVELLCSLHPQPETSASPDNVGIRTRGCLAGLGTGAYLTLAALGLEQIFVRTDACQACKWSRLGMQIEQQAGRANHYLAAWNKGASIVCIDQLDTAVERPLWDVKNPPLSRRDLFRMLSRQGQVAMARAMENGASSSKRQPGRDRMRLLSATAHFSTPISSATLEGFGFSALTISAECTACGACSKACPTSALHFERDQPETTFTISFSPQNCIGCELCAQVCVPAAITLEPDPAFEYVFGAQAAMLARSGELVRCERCKALIAARAGAHLCALCEYRRAHPFGSILPAELKALATKTAKELHS